MREARPRMFHRAGDVGGVASILARASSEGRRVTVRAAGRSFDDQAMSDDAIVDVRGWDRILTIDVEARTITVQPGASWGSIVDATLPFGLIPHVLVTTSRATAGGTLSANALSRCSPRHGHTGDHVLAFELLTPSGEHLHCSRGSNPDLFHAVIGGFGWFGVVTEITFELLALEGRTRVRTEVDRREGLEAFVERLTEASLQPGDDDAVCSVFSLGSRRRGAVLRSRYTAEPLGRPFFLHRPDSSLRTVGEAAFSSSTVGNAMCHAAFEHLFSRGPFVDEIRGYTFCMEGNERIQAIAAGVGLRLRTLQPSFVVPTEAMLPFLRDVGRTFAAFDVYPSLLDAVYRPADAFLLSSARHLAGFCASFLFCAVTASTWRRLEPCISQLNDVCLHAGGRLHLVKNVHATRSQLRAMYGDAAPELARLKARVDPRYVLSNAFFERAFG